MAYKPRLEAPSKSNKYFYKNNPFEAAGYGLPNCTAYAWGRFYEILGEKPKLSTSNAENWWSKDDGYKRGQAPKLGAVICWRKGKAGNGSDGAGHVAIVEKVYADGSILISQSGWKASKTMWTQKLKPPYKYGSAYTLQGFIYNPKTEGESNVNPEDIKIYLDYGHGGKDNGAVKYLVEDEMNLVQGRACATELRAAGFQVKESRTSDKYKSLADRVAEANEWGADLFISWHNNAGKGNGWEAWVMSAMGEMVAEAIEKRVKEFGQNSRGIKDGSDLYVIKNTNMPAVLLEGFFVDNKADAAQNDTAKEQKAYGVAVAKGVMDIYNVKPKKTATTENKKPETAKTKKNYSGTFPKLPERGYLTKGDKGTQVENLQKFLNWAIGTKLEIDGSFGNMTFSAVETFQAKYDLKVDGKFGTKSLAKAKTIKK